MSVLPGGATFGHARLSIVDLDARSHQPMHDASGRFALTYNGEVYNFRALRRELESEGARFRTESDTEVVLEALVRWGHDALDRFDGMFALALWDSLERRLLLARDRFGEKPLYYAETEGAFAFASELSALREMIPLDETPSIAALNHFLAIGYVLAPLTECAGARKLEPATWLDRSSNGSIRRSRYWNYADAFRRRANVSDADVVASLDHALSEAVRSRMVADVPVGAFLSGGLDSSLVSSYAREHHARANAFHTFSVGFSESEYDESKDAAVVASALGTTHHPIGLDGSDGVAWARRAIAAYDEAFSDTSLVPMYRVAEHASHHVKVVLSGDGADEIFAGYATHRADQAMQLLGHVPIRARATLGRAIRGLVRERAAAKQSLGFRVRQFARGLGSSASHAHFAWRLLHDEADRIALLGEQHADEIRDTCPSRTFAAHYAEVSDLPWLAQHLYVDAKTWLADDILVKVDRATMAFSIESRAPFLARDLVELAASLGPRWKLSPRESKVALRRLAARRLPRSVLTKPKAGFSPPIASWFGLRGDNEYRAFNRAVAAARRLPIPTPPGALP